MKKNKNIILIMILLAGTIISFITILRLSRKKTSHTVNPPVFINSSHLAPIENTTTTFTDIKFNGNTDSITVQSLPIVQIQQLDLLNYLNNSLNEYCHVNSNELNKYYHGSFCDYTNYEEGKKPQVVFPNAYELLTEKINVEEAKIAAQNFIQKIYTNYTPELTLTGINYFTQDNDVPVELEQVNPNQATHVWLFYSYTHHNIPLIPHNDNDSFFSFIVNGKNQINKAEIRGYIYQTKDFDKANQLLDIPTAINNIKIGNAYLSGYYAAGDITDISILSHFNKVIFNSVNLEYRINPEENLAIPVYHFAGTGYNNLNSPMGIEVVTPAINFTITPSAQ